MKTSAVLTSLLFGSFAVAAPVDKRALVYKTEVVTETVVVFTTVYDDNTVAQATTTPAGYFYEQPKVTSTPAAAKPTPQTPANSPVEEKKPSSTPAPAPQVPTPAPAPAPSPAPAPVVEQPKPIESPKPVETPQPVTSAAPAPAPAAPNSPPAPAPTYPSTGGGGSSYTGEGTIYNELTGQKGACGKGLYDADMIVALAKNTWGVSTHDVMTGESSNPWCGQQIEMHYKGNTVKATIMDLCPGCSGADLDLSPAAWRALTGGNEITRIKGVTWNKTS